MVDRAFNMHVDQVTGHPSFMSSAMKNNWVVSHGKQEYVEPAYTSFIAGGCISIDAFVNALAARATKHLNLVVVDLRELATRKFWRLILYYLENAGCCDEADASYRR